MNTINRLTTLFVLSTVMGFATPVSPGGSTNTNDLFNASQDLTLLNSDMGTWSTILANGTYKDAVYKNTSGTLDFVYQFTSSPTSHVGVSEISAYDFDSFATNVGYIINGQMLPGALFIKGTTSGDGIPTSINRSMDGSTVSFNFNDNLKPGVTSAVLMVSTNATNYETGNVGILGGAGDNLEGFQPVLATPEPSFILPLGLLMIVAGFFVMKRRKQVAIQ